MSTKTPPVMEILDPRPEPPAVDDLVGRAPARRAHGVKKANGQVNGGDFMSERMDFLDPYIRDGHGVIKPVYANVITLLRENFDQWPLRFDEFSMRYYMGDKPLDNDMVREIAEAVQRRGILASVDMTGEAMMRVAYANKFHQVRDYLTPLKWDGIDRIDSLLIDHGDADDTPLNRAIMSKFMIQSIARIFEPGCKADSVPILEGAQGVGKTWLVNTLFGKWVASELPDLNTKDAMIQLRGSWGIEIGELATLGRSDAAKIKEFLTRQTDKYREPHARLTTEIPRQCVFIGTVNVGASGYLKDETGARRFWPIKIKERVNIEAVRAIRDQLWAEAKARYKAKEPWYLDDDGLVAAAKEAQDERYAGDLWTDRIEQYIRGKSEVAVTDILTDGLGAHVVREWGRSDEMRVASVLVHLGWHKVQKKLLDGTRPRVYRPLEIQGTDLTQDLPGNRPHAPLNDRTDELNSIGDDDKSW